MKMSRRSALWLVTGLLSAVIGLVAMAVVPPSAPPIHMSCREVKTVSSWSQPSGTAELAAAASQISAQTAVFGAQWRWEMAKKCASQTIASQYRAEVDRDLVILRPLMDAIARIAAVQHVGPRDVRLPLVRPSLVVVVPTAATALLCKGMLAIHTGDREAIQHVIETAAMFSIALSRSPDSVVAANAQIAASVAEQLTREAWQSPHADILGRLKFREPLVGPRDIYNYYLLAQCRALVGRDPYWAEQRLDVNAIVRTMYGVEYPRDAKELRTTLQAGLPALHVPRFPWILLFPSVVRQRKLSEWTGRRLAFQGIKYSSSIQKPLARTEAYLGVIAASAALQEYKSEHGAFPADLSSLDIPFLQRRGHRKLSDIVAWEGEASAATGPSVSKNVEL